MSKGRPSSLKTAIRAGDIEGVRTMLRLRPELVSMNLSGFYDYPICYAVLGRNAEMVRLLLEHGADPLMGTYGGPLKMATERGYEEIVALLREKEQNRPSSVTGQLEGHLPSIPDELRAAYRRGDVGRDIALLDANPALIHPHRDGFTPLDAAV